MTRRKFLTGVGAAGAAAAYPLLIEPAWFEVTRTQVRLAGTRKGRFTVLHLSDLHAEFKDPFSPLVDAIEAGLRANPDLVCVTGDFVSLGSDVDQRRYTAALRRLSGARPTFASLGNHDGGRWTREHGGARSSTLVRRILEEANVELLLNRARTFQVNGCEFVLAGVGDLWSGEVSPGPPFDIRPNGRPILLLAHNPDSKELLQRHPWDLMLSGHTHGGQVIIPFRGPHLAPIRDKRYVAGLGSWEGRQIFVSRGVGNYLHVRFRCRPEVSILDVEVG
ncbi:MAG: phosphodiesterase YaeI [Bryobacteraceae bacterium]|nr:phosphodiesterase YaeI [Bryobacteraceae bacterium]